MQFANITAETCELHLMWGKTAISLPIVTNVRDRIRTQTETALQADKVTANTYFTAANFYYEMDKDYNKALEYVNQSLGLSNQWFNNWVKAQILAAKGMNKDAYAYALKAKELGDKNPEGFFFKTQVEKALEDWKAAAAPVKKK